MLPALEVCEQANERRRRGERAEVEQDKLDRHAWRVLCGMQAGFRYFEKQDTTQNGRRLLCALSRAQRAAIRSVVAKEEERARGLLEAKRLQIKAGRGRPLNVCIGFFARRLPSDLQSELDANHRLNRRAQELELPDQRPYDVLRVDFFTYGDGCGRIIEDSTSEHRPSFRSYCDRCNGRTTARQEARLTQIRAAWGETPIPSVTVIEPDKGLVAVYYKHCRRCRRLFKTTTAQQKNCKRGCRGSA